jgi:hypothetical protein
MFSKAVEAVASSERTIKNGEKKNVRHYEATAARPLRAEPRPNSGLPIAIPFGVPTYGSPDAALAIFEFIDEMRHIIVAVYGTHIQHASRQRCQLTPAEPAVIPNDELPF